jgi:hypothetical protein
LELVYGVDDDELEVVVALGEVRADLAELAPVAARGLVDGQPVEAGFGRDEEGVVGVELRRERALADFRLAVQDGLEVRPRVWALSSQ